MDNLYGLIAESVQSGQSAALATVVRVRGSTPREVGAKMVVYADGRTVGTVGGGKMEALVIEQAVAALAAGESRMVEYTLQDADAGDPGVCGGTAEVFIDVAAPRPTLLIAGAGHVAMPVAQVGDLCGFRVVVVDDRPDMASAERFPQADQRIVGDIAQTLAELAIHDQTYIVIVTRGHAHDEAALRAVIGSGAAYIGMIGSRHKVRATLDRLRTDGMDAALLEQVYSPIGLDIGSQTPAEIAVSILAQVIQQRRQGSATRISI